jgi:hypothetical protein
MIITGVIWGFWHAPVMMRGQYPGHPYLGAFLTIPYCVLLAIIFGWLRVASGSVWVVAVAHASLDVSSSDGVTVLAPGFDFALVGGLESLIGCDLRVRLRGLSAVAQRPLGAHQLATVHTIRTRILQGARDSRPTIRRGVTVSAAARRCRIGGRMLTDRRRECSFLGFVPTTLQFCSLASS